MRLFNKITEYVLLAFTIAVAFILIALHTLNIAALITSALGDNKDYDSNYRCIGLANKRDICVIKNVEDM